MNIENIIEKVKKDFVRQTQNKLDASVLCAVSGGPDSMFLASILSSFCEIVVASCDFQLRNESKSEIELIENWCEENNVRFLKIAFETEDYALANKISIQEGARKLRYNWFEKQRIELDLDFIATGHHQLDNVETVLWNIMRGTGIKGAGGIPAKREKIIRPILNISKKEIEYYLESKKIPFCIDKTNLISKYSRNAIRLKVLPLLDEIKEESTSNIVAFAQRCNESNAIIENQAKWYWDKYVKDENPFTVIDIEASFFINATFWYYLLKRFGVNTDQSKQFYQSKNNLIETATHSIQQHGGRIIIIDNLKKKRLLNGKVELIILANSTTPIGIWGQLEIQYKEDFRLSELMPNDFTLPISLEGQTLVIRNRQNGDRMNMFGNINRTTKLKKIFIDNHISNLEKNCTPIFEVNSKIVAVGDLKKSEITRIEEGKPCFVIRWIKAK